MYFTFSSLTNLGYYSICIKREKYATITLFMINLKLLPLFPIEYFQSIPVKILVYNECNHLYLVSVRIVLILHRNNRRFQKTHHKDIVKIYFHYYFYKQKNTQIMIYNFGNRIIFMFIQLILFVGVTLFVNVSFFKLHQLNHVLKETCLLIHFLTQEA